AIVGQLFERESKLVEKYVLRSSAEHAGGGEYPLQDGFGWTNGVTRKLMQEDARHEVHRCRAGQCRPEWAGSLGDADWGLRAGRWQAGACVRREGAPPTKSALMVPTLRRGNPNRALRAQRRGAWARSTSIAGMA